MAALLIAVFLAQAPSLSIDELIARLSSDSAEVRDKATGQVRERWKEWTEADLARLRKAAETKDAEVATRVKKSIELIELYRSLPDETWKALPEAGPTLFRNEPGQIGKLVSSMMSKCRSGELSGNAAFPVALCLIDDDRESDEEARSREGETWKIPVRHLARDLLRNLVPHAGAWSSEEWLDWWKKNRNKSEVAWLLAGLDDDSELSRGDAIVRLWKQKDPAIHARLIESLKGFESYYTFERALYGISALPEDTLLRAMKPYLADRRLSFRYEAAQILRKAMPREAIDSVIEGFALPESACRSRVMEPSDFDILSWLARTKDDRAIAFLSRSMTRGPLEWKLDAINVGGRIDDSRIEEALFQAFEDPEQRIDPTRSATQLDDPRVCDRAALRIAERLGCDEEFKWPKSVRARDRLLEGIRNRWRKTKGLPPIPFYGPGIVLVPADKVDALIPDLAHAEADRRRGALRRLSELGPGAWIPLHERIARAGPADKARLEEAATSWSNALRRVAAGNDEARRYVDALAKRLHDPFDVEAFLKEVPEAWFDRPELNEMNIKIFRGSDGRGISIDVSAGGAGKAPTDYDSFKVECGIASYVMKWDRAVFRDILRKEIKALTWAMKESPDWQANLTFSMRKWKND